MTSKMFPPAACGLTTDCPLNQYLLADALGLSAIRVTRVLRELREIKLLMFQDHRAFIHDRAGFIALAAYEDVESGSDMTVAF